MPRTRMAGSIRCWVAQPGEASRAGPGCRGSHESPPRRRARPDRLVSDTARLGPFAITKFIVQQREPDRIGLAAREELPQLVKPAVEIWASGCATFQFFLASSPLSIVPY
jgi:hypothetical protein